MNRSLQLILELPVSAVSLVLAARLLVLSLSLIACSNSEVIHGVGRFENLDTTDLRGACSSRTHNREDLKKYHLSSISSKVLVTCQRTEARDSLTAIQSHT